MNLTPEAQAIEAAYAKAREAMEESKPEEAAYHLRDLAAATIGAIERAERAEGVAVALFAAADTGGACDPGVIDDARRIQGMKQRRKL